MFYIYLIFNCVNGKLYVGKTNNPTYRFRKHKEIAMRGTQCRMHSALHAAMNKYGIDNFLFKIVESSSDNIYILKIAEPAWISSLKTNNHILYNMTNGGEGTDGWHHSSETKRKMSLIKKGKLLSENHKMSLRGKSKPSDFGQKVSFRCRGENSPSHKLTDKDVINIKQLLLSKVKQSLIAKMFSVDQSVISNIKRNKRWKHIPL